MAGPNTLPTTLAPSRGWWIGRAGTRVWKNTPENVKSVLDAARADVRVRGRRVVGEYTGTICTSAGAEGFSHNDGETGGSANAFAQQTRV